MHGFYQYASQFTLKSIIKAMSALSFELISSSDGSTNMFISQKDYHITYQGKEYSDTVVVAQTKLIDVIYEVVSSGVNGKRDISNDEALCLLHSLNNLENHKRAEEEKRLKKLKIDEKTFAGLNLFGYMGEQKRFQKATILLEDFSREKYILEKISQESNEQIDFLSEFKTETSISTDEYSAMILMLFIYFFGHRPFCFDKTISEFSDIKSEFARVISSHTTTINEVSVSTLKRQIFYAKPLLNIDDEYICVNPFLLLCLFVNSNFWVIRNKYLREGSSQQFTNAFGKYFEIYLNKLLSYCLNSDCFTRIPESNKESRADWYIKTDKYDFLVEQKSTISYLGIKQNTPDIAAMKKHILSCWGKAVKQLSKTEKAFELNNAIKIVLVYEDYFQSECLDLLFDIDNTLIDDNRYWLVTIREFEMLMHLHKTSPKLFNLIIDEKIEAENRKSKFGRDLSYFFSKHGIKDNQYLKDTKITNNFDLINSLVGKELSFINNKEGE